MAGTIIVPAFFISQEDAGNTKRASDTYKNEPPEKKNQGFGKDTGPAAIHK